MLKISEKIINYIKDLFTPQPVSADEKKKEKKDETKANKAVDGVSKVELTSTLKGLNERLKGERQPSSIKLDKMEYNPLSDSEIEQIAKNKVEQKYATQKDLLDEQVQKRRNELKDKEASLIEGGEAKKKEISALYDELSKQTEANALKRGIARSSIAQEQIKSLGVEKIKDLLSVSDEVASELKANSDKLSEYETEYNKAIKSLDIQKAIEVKEKIAEISEKQNDKLNEVLKYNNTITKQQAELDEKNPSFIEPTQQEKDLIKNKMLQEAFKYFGSMTKEQALYELKNDAELRELLGDLATIIERQFKATK